MVKFLSFKIWRRHSPKAVSVAVSPYPSCASRPSRKARLSASLWARFCSSFLNIWYRDISYHFPFRVLSSVRPPTRGKGGCYRRLCPYYDIRGPGIYRKVYLFRVHHLLFPLRSFRNRLYKVTGFNPPQIQYPRKQPLPALPPLHPKRRSCGGFFYRRLREILQNYWYV